MGREGSMGGRVLWEAGQCGREGSGQSSGPVSAAHYVTSRPAVDVPLPSPYTSPSIRIIEAKWRNSLTPRRRLCPSVSSVSPHRRHRGDSV